MADYYSTGYKVKHSIGPFSFLFGLPEGVSVDDLPGVTADPVPGYYRANFITMPSKLKVRALDEYGVTLNLWGGEEYISDRIETPMFFKKSSPPYYTVQFAFKLEGLNTEDSIRDGELAELEFLMFLWDVRSWLSAGNRLLFSPYGGILSETYVLPTGQLEIGYINDRYWHDGADIRSSYYVEGMFETRMTVKMLHSISYMF